MNRIIVLCLLALSIVTANATADTLPDYYPPAFYIWGTLNHLDTDQGIMIIDDKSIHVAPGTKVYTPDSRFGTLSSLRQGMHVGIYRKQRNSVVNEVWVLPATYKPDYTNLIIKK